jgi:chaperonin GroES
LAAIDLTETKKTNVHIFIDTFNTSMNERMYTMAKIRPVGDRVVVKAAAKEEVTKSGIVIPDTAKEKPQEGTVIAVGSGRLLDNGDRAALDVREGDHVLFAKYGGTEFKLEGEEYLVLKENDILAIIG